MSTHHIWQYRGEADYPKSRSEGARSEGGKQKPIGIASQSTRSGSCCFARRIDRDSGESSPIPASPPVQE